MSRADSRCQSTCALGRVNLGGCSAHTCVTWPGWGSHSRVYMKSPAPHLTGGVRSHSRPGRCRFSSHGAPGLRGGAGRRSVPGAAPYLAVPGTAPCPALLRTRHRSVPGGRCSLPGARQDGRMVSRWSSSCRRAGLRPGREEVPVLSKGRGRLWSAFQLGVPAAASPPAPISDFAGLWHRLW